MRLFLFFSLFHLVLVFGCQGPTRQKPAPTIKNYVKASIVGFEHVRFWADEAPPFMKEFIEGLRKAIEINPQLAKRYDLLALSGGAEKGAYGAGFLKGWTKRGNRPEFTWVTGISTGAILAPFAFLGSKYDKNIEEFFTETDTEAVFSLQPVSALFGASSLTDTSPLRKTIRKNINAELVAEIANETRRGRHLFIYTTNLDAERPVCWDIGKIAKIGTKEAVELIGDVILASAAIPGAFPPVAFDVLVDGEIRQELHVDGGVTHEIFAYPPQMNMAKVDDTLGISPKKYFWLIRNGTIGSSYEVTNDSVTGIMKRALNTLIKYQGVSDLVALERLASRDRFKFNVVYIPEDFKHPTNEFFDPSYMRALFDVGYTEGLQEDPWRKDMGAVLGQDHYEVLGDNNLEGEIIKNAPKTGIPTKSSPPSR